MGMEKPVKKRLWILVLLPLLCGLALWLYDAYLWRASEAYVPTEVPVDNEHVQYIDIIQGGALHLKDAGKGYVGIGYGDTQWPGIILWRKQDLTAVLDMITSESPSSSGPSSRQIAKLRIGQETTFGGYRIKVIDIWSSGGLSQSSIWARLAISLEEVPK